MCRVGVTWGPGQTGFAPQPWGGRPDTAVNSLHGGKPFPPRSQVFQAEVLHQNLGSPTDRRPDPIWNLPKWGCSSGINVSVLDSPKLVDQAYVD